MSDDTALDIGDLDIGDVIFSVGCVVHGKQTDEPCHTVSGIDGSGNVAAACHSRMVAFLELLRDEAVDD